MPVAASLLVLIVVVSSLSSVVHADDADLEQRVDAYLQPFLDAGHLSGTILIARDDTVVYQRAFGFADRELDVSNTPVTVFGIGSVNKPMTIAILAQLIEKGQIALQDKLSKYAPDFPRGDEITIKHLLDHAAGIPHRVTSELDETRPQTAASMLTLASRVELVFEPGTDSVYSSAGFSVLARAMEVASGESYVQLLQRFVLAPAGMTATSDAGSRAIVKGRAKAYYFDSAGLVNAPPGDISYLIGAGSVFSTPADLFAMQRALRAGSFGELAQAFLVRDDGSLSWNGSAAGYRTFADYDAESGISLIMSSNLTSGAINRVRDNVPGIVRGDDVPVPAPIRARPVQLDAETLAGFEGAYALRPGRNLQLSVVGGQLLMDDWLLIPTSGTTLFSPQDYAEIIVVRGDDGEVERLDWKIGDDVYPLPRVEP